MHFAEKHTIQCAGLQVELRYYRFVGQKQSEVIWLDAEKLVDDYTEGLPITSVFEDVKDENAFRVLEAHEAFTYMWVCEPNKSQ